MGDAISDTTNEDSVEAALTEYFLRRDRGQDVDLNAFISAYPGCEGELRKLVARERLINQAMAAGSPTAAPSQDLAGRTLGDFRLLRLIGRGGMGVVWEAEQRLLDRKVAVKLLPGALCADPRHRTRFQNEARILAQLAHPNIVSVIAVGEEADTYYFAMQYIDGITADDLIRLWSDEKAPRDAETAVDAILDGDTEDSLAQENGQTAVKTPHWIADRANRHERYRQCARIASEVADGLAHAHACGVLHRDVKPSNILLDHSGSARLTDFGLARMHGDATLTATGTILGTFRYASPEQLGGTEAGADERSDIYSLGATLWELVTGKRLFTAGDHNSVITQVLKVEALRPSSLAAGLPRDLETIITRAMAKEPADRYASAQAFADDLTRFLDGRPIQAKPISLGERAFRWANRNRTLTTTALGTLAALAVVALLASALVLRANSRTAAALNESRVNEAQANNSARTTRELLYATDMALAGDAWHKNQPGQAKMMLDRYTQPITRVDGSKEDDLRGFEWYFLDRQIRPQSDLLFQTEKALYLIEFMPDPTEFFTAGEDSIVRWHNASTGKVLRSLDTQQTEINCVSYNPAGTLFATAGDDGTVKIWNAADRTLLRSIRLTDQRCYFAKFIDSDRVFTGGDTKSQQLFNATTGECVREYIPQNATAAGGASAPGSMDAYVSRTKDRAWVCVGLSNQRYEGVCEWDLSTGTSRSLSKISSSSRVLPDRAEQFLFVDSRDGDVHILDVKNGSERWSSQLDVQPVALALSPDESRLVAGDRTGQVYLWNLDLNNPKAIVSSKAPQKLSVHNRSVYGIEFTSDGNSMLTVGGDGAVRRTKLRAPAGIYRELKWLSGQIGCAAIRESNLVVTLRPLAVRDRLTGSLIKTLSTDPYQALTVSSDGTLVAAGSYSQIGVWSIATGQRMLRVELQRRSVACLDFSLDNSLLAVASNDGNTRVDVVEIATGKSTRYTAPEHSAGVVYFCTDDSLIAQYSTPYQLVCWTVPDRQILWQVRPSDTRIHRATLSPDRTLLLAHMRTRDLRLIESATGAVRYEAPDDYDPGSFAFVGDGRSFVVSNSRGGQLSLWHTATGRRLFEIANIETGINSIQRLDHGFLASTRRVKDGRTELVWYEF